MDYMLNATNNEGTKMTHNDIVNQMTTLLPECDNDIHTVIDMLSCKFGHDAETLLDMYDVGLEDES